MIEWGSYNNIEFDKEKMELIHFYKGRYTEDETRYTVQISDTIIIKPKTEVRWLGIWFDRTLSFKPHIDKVLAKANRVYNQIARLANCGKGLSFQAMRQLYQACVTSIADYGVPVWWKGQRHYLERFQKLQNSMLRKILGAFKTTPTAAMEIEASILPVKIRFNKICQKYAFRAIQLDQGHPIKERTPDSFPHSRGDIELDWDKYLDWNQEDRSKKKIYPTQLYRVLNSIASSISSLNIEESGYQKQAPWLKHPIEFEPIKDSNLDRDRDKIALAHDQAIQDIALRNCIIGYTDGSKLENLNTGAGLYLINGTEFSETRQEYSWHLGVNTEVYDAELFAISKAIQYSQDIVKSSNIEVAESTSVCIYTDSKAAIDRLKKLHDIGPGFSIVQKCIQLASRITSYGARIAIRWIPGHANIPGNERADQLAKKGANTPQLNPQIKVSLTNIRRKLNKSIIDDWHRDWDQNTAKGRHYNKTGPRIARKAIKSITDRRTWTAYIQLKFGHGYFRSYLHRITRSDTDRCIGRCQGIQSPMHLYLSCYHYKEEQKELVSQLKDLYPRQLITLAEIYAEKSRQTVYNYLRKTRIATREWLLGLENGENTENN